MHENVERIVEVLIENFPCQVYYALREVCVYVNFDGGQVPVVIHDFFKGDPNEKQLQLALFASGQEERRGMGKT